jgi:hypothetical protein
MPVAGLPYLPEGTPWPRRNGRSIWGDGGEAWPSAKLCPCASTSPRLSGSAQPAKSTPAAVMIRCMGFMTVSVPQGEPPMSSAVAQSLVRAGMPAQRASTGALLASHHCASQQTRDLHNRACSPSEPPFPRGRDGWSPRPCMVRPHPRGTPDFRAGPSPNLGGSRGHVAASVDGAREPPCVAIATGVEHRYGAAALPGRYR